MVRIYALKETIESGEQKYPIYLALMQAEAISEIADVPSYHDTTKNAEIAHNVSKVPVKEWQRPPIPEKIEAIRQMFNNSGEFMPNPILIGQNPHTTSPPNVESVLTSGDATTVWELVIDQPPSDSEKPLWILDGQHRIAGLSKSAQSSNPVPVVFLLNHGSDHYGADRLAQIFAQVTTSATQLGPLHSEWLSYAFRLNHYSPREARAAEQKNSMAAVISLCMTPSFGGQPNPFYDRIQYNDRLTPSRIQPGGHVYTCIELKDIVFRSYYSAPKVQPELESDALAEEMCLARIALVDVVKTPVDRSVFFGKDSHHQKVMEDAFWSGVLSHIGAHGAPPSWKDVLRTLRFESTDWDFSWKVSLHGRNQSTSKKLAVRVMEEIFPKRKLPSGNNSIADLLRGNGAQFKLEAFHLTSSDRPSTREAEVLEVRRGDTTSFPIGQRVGIRLRNPSLNIQEVVVTDKQAAPGTLVEYREVLKGGGLILDKSSHNSPLDLLFTLKHYGGVTSTAEVRIDWQP